MKFKVGDRIIVRQWGNSTGTVVRIKVQNTEYPILVRFDDDHDNDSSLYDFTEDGVYDIDNNFSTAKLEHLTPLEKLL